MYHRVTWRVGLPLGKAVRLLGETPPASSRRVRALARPPAASWWDLAGVTPSSDSWTHCQPPL